MNYLPEEPGLVYQSNIIVLLLDLIALVSRKGAPCWSSSYYNVNWLLGSYELNTHRNSSQPFRGAARIRSSTYFFKKGTLSESFGIVCTKRWSLTN